MKSSGRTRAAADTHVEHAGHAKRHVRGLDGLRALAVVLVFLSHKAHVEAIDVGKLGVWIFFLISGFLIIGELHRDRLRIEAGSARRQAVMCVFFMKRALRIFPIYYLLLIALSIAHALFYQRDVDLGLAWHFAFLSNYWIGVVKDGWPGSVSHFWSLAVEQQFYLVAPFLLVLTPASQHRMVCVLMVVAGAVGHLAMHAADASEPLLYAFSPLNAALLALGGLCGVMGQQGIAGGRSSIGIAGALGVLLFATLPIWDRWTLPARLANSAWIDIGLALSLCMLFAWIVGRPGGFVVRALECEPLAYLGTISYGFYLFHNLIPARLGHVPSWFAWLHAPSWMPTLFALTLQFALAVLLAHLSWHLIEKRLLELKKPLEAAIARRLPAVRAQTQTQTQSR